jgi:hypothetical protein
MRHIFGGMKHVLAKCSVPGLNEIAHSIFDYVILISVYSD